MRKTPRLVHGLWTLVALLGLLLPTTGWAHGLQESEMPAGAIAAMGAMMVFFVIFALAFYVYFALCLQTIAKKPLWWIILCLIPLVNIIIFIIVWMAIAEARGKPNWWGILLIVPVVGIIVPGYLAFSD
jgi:hypothetical protein